jgi:hypothetical protein
LRNDCGRSRLHVEAIARAHETETARRANDRLLAVHLDVAPANHVELVVLDHDGGVLVDAAAEQLGSPSRRINTAGCH